MSNNGPTAADVLKDLNVHKEEVQTPQQIANIPNVETVVRTEDNGVQVVQSGSIEDDLSKHEKDIRKQITQEVNDSMSSQSNVDYETQVSIPSRGIIYGGTIPSEISLRSMTTKDEKILYASQGQNVFHKILKSCVTDPAGLDTSKMIAADELFLVLQLRMITFGPEYKVDVRCPNCGATETYVVMLNELFVHYLDPSFKEPIEVKLPRSGDTLSLRLLRNEDVDFIERYSRKFAKQFGLDAREVEYSARLARYITAINGNAVDFESAIEYVDELASRDTAEVRSKLQKILVGVDTSVTVECKNCQEEFTFNMPLTSEFFRPTFE